MITEKKQSGFTLVELVVVMIIVGVLSTISVPLYRHYVLMARAQEGYALLGGVANSLRAYYAEFGTFVDADEEIIVDITANQYFQDYSYEELTQNSFIVVTSYDDSASGQTLIVTMTGGSERPTVMDDNISLLN